MKIGVIGAGRLGICFALLCEQAGYDVIVSDCREDYVKGLQNHTIETTEPEVNMGKGIMSITCPSCATVHNVDENTPKFICSCGRRIRT